MNKNLHGLFTSQFALLLLACTLCTQAKAQTNKSFNDTKEACATVLGRERAGERFGHIVNCGADILSVHPIAPAAKSIVPGSGIGFGVTSKVDILKQALPNFDTTLTTNARLSLTRFWTADSSVLFSRKPTDGSNYGWNMKPYISRLELPHMDFYGLGGQTALSNLVSFNERETVGGFTGECPIKFGT